MADLKKEQNGNKRENENISVYENKGIMLKSLAASLITAFSAYTKIPMPYIEWREQNQRYALCFFPLAGAMLGVLFYLVHWLCTFFGVKEPLAAAVLTVLPLAFTGGIHMDGFCDTSDALSSWADKEKKLEIMKDSRSGAFAVISACAYFILYYGAVSGISSVQSALVGAGFVMSRAMSAFSIAVLKPAKNRGMVSSMKKYSEKRALTITSAAIFAAAVVFAAYIVPLAGAVYGLLGAAMVYIYKYIVYKNFGGITGDTSGFLLQTAELIFLIAATVIV